MATGLSSIFRRSRLFNPESLLWWKWNDPRRVDIVTGCFMLIKKQLWLRLNGFDLRFFMYCEDADLCFRSKYLCQYPVIVPKVEIIHYGGASDTVRADKLIRLIQAKNRLFQKHWPVGKYKYALIMLYIWVYTRKIFYWVCATLIRKSYSFQYEQWNDVLKRKKEWFTLISISQYGYGG